MDLSLSEEQLMLYKGAREFLETECPKTLVRELEKSEEGYSPELWHKMAELGWLGIVFPEKYGGTGSTILDLAVLYEEVGRALLPSPHLSTVVLCGLTILAAGSEAQKEEFLPRIAKGESILALAWTEPSAGYGPESIAVSAVPDGDEYLISGTKLFISDAHIADYFLCVTRTKNGATPEEGVTLFLVDAKSPGISRVPLPTISGDKQFEVSFDKVRVPQQNMVGELHRGWAVFFEIIQQAAVLQCAAMVGGAQAVTEIAVDYAKTRVQYENVIGVNQAIQWKCVDMSLAVSNGRAITLQAAGKLSQGLPATLDVAMAQAYLSDAYPHVCWEGHEILAGVAFTVEHDMQLYSRRAKATQVQLGDVNFWNEIVEHQLDLS